MDAFAKYLQQVSDGLNVLSGDIQRIIIDKEKQIKEENKKKEEKKPAEQVNTIKQTAQEHFKSISLKSMQPVTKLYKNEKEIKKAQENPEMDFINKKVEDIFKG